MRALASPSGGICVLDVQPVPTFVDVNRMTAVPAEVAHLLCGCLADWEILEGQVSDALLSDARLRHQRTRAVANIESCLLGVPPVLRRDLLLEVDDLIRDGVSRDAILADLLRAPLRQTQALADLANACAALGIGAVAFLLDRVRDAQPLLQRLVDRWLALPDVLFLPLPAGRKSLWTMAAHDGVVLTTLDATSGARVREAWAGLVFRYHLPAYRLCIAAVSRAIATALFPSSECAQADAREVSAAAADDAAQEEDALATAVDDPHAAHQRALKQVNAVVAAVSQGKDAQARRFLRELVADQLEFSGGAEHLVKSLCNIAQQCAEMFRTDFEFECLQQAIGMAPRDPWTLLQLADHYKRAGRFDDALALVDDAERYGDRSVATCVRAGILGRMGSFDEALALYAAIPGGESDPVIRGARADILRRSGQLDAAVAEYHRIMDEGLATDRVYAGLLEVAKRQGRLVEARDGYERLLAAGVADQQSSVVYRMALANVLVRLGCLADAYRCLDEVVQLRPFARQARALRAAVAGLMGDAETALDELPEVGGSQAFDEWVHDYIRGLLLLMLDRYADARRVLLREVEAGLLDAEAANMLRLGAAVCVLRDRVGVAAASEHLAAMSPMKDAFADAVRSALLYHVAVSRGDAASIARLTRELEEVPDEGIRELTEAIERLDWKRAWHLEVETVLRLVA